MPRAALLAISLLFLALQPPAATSQAARPQVVLTLKNGERSLDLTLEELAAMPQHAVATENEFTEGMVTFAGPLALDVLRRVDLHKLQQVRFTALNDYSVDVPVQDLREYDVILAMEAEGRRLSRRAKGPLWLIYPMTEHPELAVPQISARLIWQVRRISTP